MDKTKSFALQLIELLYQQNIKHVFGIPGGAIAPILKALRQFKKVEYVIAAHEGGAAYMADGYARMKNRPGFVFVTSGPGATNALTGIACAQAAGVPVFLISGQSATHMFHRGSIQESTNDGVNIIEIFRHACEVSELAGNPNSLYRIFFKAWRACMATPGRAVHLSIPLDVSSHQFAINSLEQLVKPWDLVSSPIDLGQVKEAFGMISQAIRPLIFLGSGARKTFENNPERLNKFSELLLRLGIPVATSAQAKGIFPESHPCSLGAYAISGSEQAVKFISEKAPDVTLVIGSSLGEWTTQSWDKNFEPTQALIQVDIDQRKIGMAFPTKLSILGDAGAFIDGFLECILKEATQPNWENNRVFLKAFKSKFVGELEIKSEFVAPQQVMYTLNEITTEKTSYFIDCGNCMSWAVHLLKIDPPAQHFMTTTVATMGWANGAVIGAKLAAPERDCICVTGDGSFLMNGQEICTAAKYNVGVVYVVLFDNSLGMVNQGEHITSRKELPMDDGYYDLGGPDLCKFSEGLGARACLVDRADDLKLELSRAILEARIKNKPQVVVVKIDSKIFPPSLSRFESLLKQTEKK